MQATGQIKNQIITFAFIAAIIATACISIWYFKTSYLKDSAHYEEVQSEEGVWDLRGYDFSDGFVRAMGEVEYIPDELLSPEEFALRGIESKVGFPGQETNISTSRMRLLLPSGETYALSDSSTDFNVTVFINGKLVAQAGSPGLTEQTSAPGHKYLYLEVRPEDGGVEIVQQTSNFVHRESGDHAGFYVGSPQMIQQYASLNMGMSSAMMWMFGALFLVHIILFLIFRSYRANLYFALFCAVWCLRSGVTGMKILTEMFPAIPWEAAFRIEYMSIPLASLFLILMLGEMYPGLFKKWFINLVALVSAGFAVFYLLAPTLLMSQTLTVFQAFYMAAIAVVAVRLLTGLPRRIRAGRVGTESVLTLIGVLAFLYAAVHDALYYNGVYLFGLNNPITDVALLLFVFLQMTAMFYGTYASERAAWQKERLATEEAERLRKQVKAREELVSNIPEGSLLTRGPLVMNTLSGTAFLHDTDMLLTHKQFALLLYLVQNEGRYFTAAQLYGQVWEQDAGENTGALTTAISRLRKKLLTADGMLAIQSKRGQGYAFRFTPEQGK